MGDRGNIIVKGNNEEIYLYTHWGGSELREILRSALRRGKNRWDDYHYLNRIIFCEMIKDDVLGLIGFGISSEMQDGGADIHVDVDSQKVDGTTFEEFIKE